MANNVELALPYGDSTHARRPRLAGPVGQSRYVRNHERIQLNLNGKRFRYYLLWITTLPPQKESASIADLTLFK